jgi:hypothetical protein
LGFLLEQCTLTIYDEELLNKAKKFDCGDTDLNEFFSKDLINYSDQLLGKSYCFTLDNDPTIIVCAFTISNDSIKTIHLPNNRKRNLTKLIPHEKQMRSYPAVLIGRLAVHKDFRFISGESERTGDQMIDFIKYWFIDINNKTACRFLVVDAYNEENVIKFYEKNGFKMLFNTEEQELNYYSYHDGNKLATRLMYFDLIVLKTN